VHADGGRLTYHPERGGGLSDVVRTVPLRLHHYVVKSRAEFDRMKSPRGSATVLSRKKGESYFCHHDRNDISAPMPAWIVERTNEEMERIREQLRSVGCDDATICLDRAIVSLQPVDGGILAN
jgi:hypothetical protein